MLVGLQLVGTMASLYLPSLNGKIIDEGVAKGDTGYIVRTGGWMLAVSLVQIVATVAATYLGAKSAAGLGRDLRAGIFARVGDFSAQEVSRFGAPTLISRNTNDVTQVQTVVFMGAAMMVSAPIMMVGGIIMALREDVGLSWLVAVAVPALALSVALVIRKMIPQFRLMQESVDWVNRVLREQITGIRVVRAFVREDHEQARFAEANTQYTGTALAVGRLMALIFPIVMLIFNASTVAVLWFGVAPRRERPDADRRAHRLHELPHADPHVGHDGDLHVDDDPARDGLGRTHHRGARHRLDRRPADRTRSRSRRTGTTRGAARRRVLLPRRGCACPARGFDDRRARQDHRDHRQHRRRQVDPAVADPAPLRRHRRVGAARRGRRARGGPRGRLVADRAGAAEALPLHRHGRLQPALRRLGRDRRRALGGACGSRRPRTSSGPCREGLDSPIAQGGTNVSGGQRQRLAIARALVAKPEVFLFDDSFSALDLSTDARLRSALRPVTRHTAVIVVAQRVSTIIDADHIVVLDDGKVVGAGRHDELLETCPTYVEIVESQRSAEEAAA